MNNVQIIQPELENFLILEKLTKNEYKSSSDDKRYIIDNKLNKIIFTNTMNSKKKFFYKDDINTVDVLHIILKNFKNSVILERYSTLTEPLSHLTLFKYKNQNFYFYYEIANLYLNNIELFDSTSRQISSFIYNKNHTVIPTISYRYEKIEFFVKDNALQQITINKDIYNKSFITNRFYQHLSSVIIGKITIGEPLYIKSFTLSNNVIIDVFQEKKYNIMDATQKFLICKRIYKFLEPKWDFSLLLEDTPRLLNTKSYHMFPDNILGMNASEAENLILNTYSSIQEVQIIPQNTVVTTVILENVIRLFIDDNNIVTDLETPINFIPPVEKPPTQIDDTIDFTPLPSPPPVENPPTEIGDTIDITPLPSPPPEFDLADINISKQQITNVVKSTKKWPVFTLYMKYIRYLNGENDSFSNLSQKEIKALFENKNTITFKNNISQKRRANLTKRANAFFNFITSDNAIYNFFMIKIITEDTKYSHLPYYIIKGYTLGLTSKDIEEEFKKFQENLKTLSNDKKFDFTINDEFRFYVNVLEGKEIKDLKSEFKNADFSQPQLHAAMQNPKTNIKQVMDFRRNIYITLVSNFSKAPTQVELNSSKYTIFPEAKTERDRRITERKYKNLYYNNTNNLINPDIAVERSIKKNPSFRAAFMYLNIEKGKDVATLVNNASQVFQNLHRLPRSEYENKQLTKQTRYPNMNNYTNRYRNISVFMKKSLYMTQGIRSSFEKSVKRYSTITSKTYNDNKLIKEEYDKVKKLKLETGPVTEDPGGQTPVEETPREETPGDQTPVEEETPVTEKPPGEQTPVKPPQNNFGKNTKTPIYFEIPNTNYKYVLTKIDGGKGIYKLVENGKIVPDVPDFDLFHNIINEFEGEFTSDFAKEYNDKNYGNDNNNINFETAQELDVTKIEQELQNEIARSKKFNADTNLNIVKKIPSGLAVHLNTEANSEFVSVNDKDTLTKNTKVKLGEEDYLLNTENKTLTTATLEGNNEINQINETLNKYNDNLKKQLCDPDTKLKEFLRSKVKDIETDISKKNSFVIKKKIEVMIDGQLKQFETEHIVEKMNVNTVDTDKIRIVEQSVRISDKYSYVKTIDGKNYLTEAKIDADLGGNTFKLLDNLNNILELVDNLNVPNADVDVNKIKNNILKSLNQNFEKANKLNNVTFYEISEVNAFQTNGKVKRFETLVKGKNLTFLNKYVLAKRGFYDIKNDEIDFVKLAGLSDPEIAELIDELKTTQFKFKEVDNFQLVKERIMLTSDETTFQNKTNIKKLVKFLPDNVDSDTTFDELLEKTGAEGFFQDHKDIEESLEKMDNLKKYEVSVLDNKTLYIDETNNTFIGEFEEEDTPKSLLKYGEQQYDLTENYSVTTDDKELRRRSDKTLITLDTEYDKIGSMIQNDTNGQQDARITQNNLVFVDDFKQGEQTIRNALNLNLKTGMATIASKDIDTGTIDDLRKIQYDISSYTTNRNIWETDKNYIVDVNINTKGVIPAVSKISYIFPKEAIPNSDGSVSTDEFKSKPILEVTIDNSDSSPLIKSFESEEEVPFNKNNLHIDYSQYTQNLKYKQIKPSNNYRENINSVQSSYLSLPESDTQNVRIDRNFFIDYIFTVDDIQQILDSININFPSSNQPLTMEDLNSLYPEGSFDLEPPITEAELNGERAIKLEMLKNELNLRARNRQILQNIHDMVDSTSVDKLVKLKFNTFNNNAILIGNLEQEELRTQFMRSPTKAYDLYVSLRNIFPNLLPIIDGDPVLFYETYNNYLKNKAINTILHTPNFTEHNFYFDNMFESQLIKDSVINVDPDVLLVTQKTFCTVQPYLNEDGTIGYIQNVLDVDPQQLLEDDNMNRNFVIYDEKRTTETGKQSFITIYKAKDRITGENVWRELPPEVVETRDRLYLEDMKNKRQFSAIDTSINSFNYNKQQDIINMSQMMKNYEEHKVAFHNSYDSGKSNLLKTTVIIEPDLEDIDKYINELKNFYININEKRKFNRFKKKVEKDYELNLEKLKNHLNELNNESGNSNLEEEIKEINEKIQKFEENKLTNINKLTLGLEVEDINPITFENSLAKYQDGVGKNFYNWFVKKKNLHKSLDDEVIKQHNQKFKNMQLNEWKKDSEYKKLETNKMIKDNLSAREVKKSVFIEQNIDNVFKNIGDKKLLYDNTQIQDIANRAEKAGLNISYIKDKDILSEIKYIQYDNTIDDIGDDFLSYKYSFDENISKLLKTNEKFRQDFFNCLESFIMLDIEDDMYDYLKDIRYSDFNEKFIPSFAEKDKRFEKFIDKNDNVDTQKVETIFNSNDPKDLKDKNLLRNAALRLKALEYRAINVEQGGQLDNTLRDYEFDLSALNNNFTDATNVTSKLDFYREFIDEYEELNTLSYRKKIEFFLKMTNQHIKPYLGSHDVKDTLNPDNFEIIDKMNTDNNGKKTEINTHVKNLVNRYQVEETLKTFITKIEENFNFDETEDMETVKDIIKKSTLITPEDIELFNYLVDVAEFKDYDDFVDNVENIANRNSYDFNESNNKVKISKQKKIFKEFINSPFELKELKDAVDLEETYLGEQKNMIKKIIDLEEKTKNKIIDTRNENIEDLKEEVEKISNRTAMNKFITERGTDKGGSWTEIRKSYRELIIDKELKGRRQADSERDLKSIEDIEKMERQVRQNNLKYGNLIEQDNFKEIDDIVDRMKQNSTSVKTSFDIELVQNESSLGQMENMRIMKENVINFLQKERVRKGKKEIANNNKLIRSVERAFDILGETPSMTQINEFNKFVNEILQEKFKYYVNTKENKNLFKDQLPNTKVDENFIVNIEKNQSKYRTQDFDEPITTDETRIFDSRIDNVNKELLKEFNKYQIVDSTAPRNIAKRAKNFNDTFSKTKTVKSTKKILAKHNNKGLLTGLLTEDKSSTYLFKFFALYSVDEDYAKDYLGAIMYNDWDKLNTSEISERNKKITEVFNEIKNGIKNANPSTEIDEINEINEIRDSFSFLKVRKNKEFNESEDIVKLLRTQIERDVGENKSMLEENNRVFEQKTKDAYIDDNVKFYEKESLLSLDKNDNFFKYVPPEGEEVILRRVTKSGAQFWLPFRNDPDNPIGKEEILTYRDWLKHAKTQEYIKNNGNQVDPPLTEKGENWGDFYTKATPELRKVFDLDFVSLDQFDWQEKDGVISATYSKKVNTKNVFGMFEATFLMNNVQKREKLKRKYAQYLDNVAIQAKLDVGQPILIEGVYFMKVPSYGAETLIGDEKVKDQFYLTKITEQQMREANERGVDIDFENKLKFRRNIRENFNIDLPNEIIDLMEENFKDIKRFNAFHFYKINRIVDDLIKNLETTNIEDLFDNNKTNNAKSILPKINKKEILDEVDEIVKNKGGDFTKGKVPPSLIPRCEKYYNEYKAIGVENNAQNKKKRKILRKKFERDVKMPIEEEQKQAVKKTLITLKDLSTETADPTRILNTFSRLADTFQAHRDLTSKKANLRESMKLLLDDYRNDPKNNFTDDQKAKLKLYFNHAMFYNPSVFNEKHIRTEFERNAKSFGIVDSKIIQNIPIPQDLDVAEVYMENSPYKRGLYSTFYRATHMWNTLSTRTKMIIGGVGTLSVLGLGIWGVSSWVNQTKRDDECNINNFDPETGAFTRPDTCVPLSIQEMINKCAHQSNTDVDGTWIYNINLDGTTRHSGDDPQDPDLLCTENLDVDNTKLLRGKDKCHQFCTLVQQIEPEDPVGDVDLGHTTSIPIGEYRITDIEGITGLSFDALVEQFGIGNIYTKLILGITEQEYNDLLITVENFQEILGEYGSVNAGIPVSILASKYSVEKNIIKEELDLEEDEYNNYLMKESDFEELFVL